MNDTPGYEKPIIPGGGEHPGDWDHTKINRAFSWLDVTDAVGQSGKYMVIKQFWESGFETFLRSTQASLSQAWSGPAAEQSKRAIQDYIDKYARPVTPALEELSNRIREAADAIVDTKNRLPETIHVDGAVERWWNTLMNDDEIGRRTEEARVVMKTAYVDRFVELDTKVPVIPVPVGPTSTTDIPVPPPGGYNTDTGNSSTTTSGNPNGVTAGDSPNGEAPRTTEDPQGEVPAEDQTAQPAPSSFGETATTPTGTETPSTTPTVPASTAPSGVTTGPGYPGGTPSGTPGGPETPGPGRTVQGAPTAGPGGSAGAAAAAGTAAAGSRGTGGMPMGGAGAGRGGGQDEDSKRSLPDYLITQENTDELLGEVPRTIEGGVIGSNPE